MASCRLAKGLCIVGLVLAAGASFAQKTSTTWVRKVYNNTNARFNGYYYAKLKMNETEHQVITRRTDDYDQLLPLFLVGNPQDAISANDMDSVIRRLTLIIKKFDSKKWNDDAYFMIGKAYFYKKDYQSALAAFQLVSARYANPLQNAVKNNRTNRVDKNVNKYTGTRKEQPATRPIWHRLKHQAIDYTNLLWLIRTHAMLGNFGEAHSLIGFLDGDASFPADLRDELKIMHAFVFIQQKQYRNAIDPLSTAIGLIRNKQLLTRYTYILAQLYQLTGQYGRAAELFSKVSDLYPTVEMDFRARVEVARNFLQSGTGSPAQIIETLEQIAQDKKFSNFRDEIYYYIGLVFLKQGREEQAVEAFQSAITHSGPNTHLKGLSFLRIGELALKKKDYLVAAAHYDSAVQFLTPKLDTLSRVQEIHVVLDELLQLRKVIQQEDSLQQLAAMDPKELQKLINRELAKQKKDKEESEFFVAANPQQAAPNPTTSGSWYFYNPSLRSTGYNEFLAKWGNRKDEDHWRRSDKRSDYASHEVGQADDDDKLDAAQPIDEEEAARQALMSHIPLTEEKKQASNQRILSAYLQLGHLYYYGLQDVSMAMQTYETAVARFATHPDMDKGYYALYLIYEQQGLIVQAERTKQTLMAHYPNSMYTLILTDPNHLAQQRQKEYAAQQWYAAAYHDFLQKDFSSVLYRYRRADSLFQPNPLKAKFDLLRALVVGSTGDRNAYIAALDSIVRTYPSGEVHDQARQYLALLGAPPRDPKPVTTPVSPKQLTKNTGPSPYNFRPKNIHYAVVGFKTVDPKIKMLSDSIIRYNNRHYASAGLKTTLQLLDKSAQMIVVRQFTSAFDAYEYYDDLASEETMFDAVETIGYRFFVIDDKNFQTLLQRKNLDEYVDFFERHYEETDWEEDIEETEE